MNTQRTSLMILAILCSAITVAEELWIPGQSQSSIGDWFKRPTPRLPVWARKKIRELEEKLQGEK